MKKITLLLLALLVSVTVLYATEDKCDNGIITVTGRAKKEVMPDKILLEISVYQKSLPRGYTVASVQDSLIRNLTAIGIDVDEKLRVKSMGSHIQLRIIKDKNLQTAIYTLEINNVAVLEKVMSIAKKCHVGHLTMLSATVSNEREIKLEMRSEAVKDAKLKAEAMLNPLGLSVGKVHVMRDETRPVYSSNNAIVIRGLAAEAAPATDGYEEKESLKMKSVELNAAVYVEFEITEKK